VGAFIPTLAQAQALMLAMGRGTNKNKEILAGNLSLAASTCIRMQEAPA